MLLGDRSSQNAVRAADTTTATRASTLYNHAVAIVNRDLSLDIEAKKLIVSSLLTKDDVVKLRDASIAKYLYTQQMTKEAYVALKYPPAYHTKDKEQYEKFTDEELAAGLDNELDDAYREQRMKPAEAKFAEADKVFETGQKVSGTSTQFGLDGVFFTITLFLGGMALVLKSHIRWGFISAGFISLAYAAMKMFSLPWYHS
ncbi:MAG TPA: hypothetical protein VMU96_12280 [Casimicrobiaceae bacterium]|nr:hypothetical protein [Casimicrobiaceae bacterium]